MFQLKNFKKSTGSRDRNACSSYTENVINCEQTLKYSTIISLCP